MIVGGEQLLVSLISRSHELRIQGYRNRWRFILEFRMEVIITYCIGISIQVLPSRYISMIDQHSNIFLFLLDSIGRKED